MNYALILEMQSGNKFVKSALFVIPVKAGIQLNVSA